MKVLIAVNAYIKNKSQISQAERIKEELEKSGATAVIERNFDLARIVKRGIVGGQFDICVFLDKDRVAARLLENCGIRLYNRASAIEVCDDKMLTNIALANAGFPVPDCMYAPLCYYADAELNGGFLQSVEKNLGFPLVAKTNYGSLGAGVFKIDGEKALSDFEREHMLSPHFYQKFIGRGGEDTRVIVVGGKVVCAMRRINDGDFRSNIELGGRGEKVVCGNELETLCTGVAKELRLDYCGVDVLTDTDGKNYICEVNSNAFFAAAERVCGVNVAAAYAKHILSDFKK